MKSCFLFGHRDTPQSVLAGLERAIEEEIQNGTSIFYAGDHGIFDSLAATALRAVKQRHREVSIMLVLTHHPAERAAELPVDFDGTFYPPLETVPHRFGLVRANQYMVKTADSIICYAKYPGNAMKLWELAMKQTETRQLQVNNLAETE